MTPELKGKISLDTSDLSKSEVALRNFEDNIKGVFKRTGDIRAATAIEGFTERLASGDVTGAIEGIVRRITGLGLLGGAAFGVVAFGINRAVTAANDLNKALDDMNTQLARQPTAGMGVDALTQMALEGAKKVGAAAESTPLANLGNRLMEVAKRMFDFKSSGEDLQKAYDKLDSTKLDVMSAQAVQIADAFSEAAKAADALAVVDVSKAMGDPNITSELQAQLEYDKQIAKISSDITEFWINYGDAIALLPPEIQRVIDKNLELYRASRTTEAGKAFRATDDVAERNKQLAEEQLKTTAEISGVKAQGLSADVEKNVLAQKNVEHLQRQLVIQHGMEESVRKQTQSQIDATKAEQAGEAKRRGVAALMPTLEASQLSFQDLLQAGPHQGSVAMIEGHQAALRAQREADIGKRLASQGFQEEAFVHLARAETIKAGIPILKESEKMQYGLTAAIDSAGVFKAMVGYLNTIAGAVKSQTNPFLNQ